ncbi:MAG: hypothetical protein ACQEQI_07060 [Bacillota bacterium]
MPTSARNKLKGTITNLQSNEVTTEVVIIILENKKFALQLLLTQLRS